MIYIIILVIIGYLDHTGNMHFVGYLNIHIRSEAYADQNRSSQFGLGIIKVNGTDYSPHHRGYNFVTINASTGRIHYFVYYPRVIRPTWYDDVNV